MFRGIKKIKRLAFYIVMCGCMICSIPALAQQPVFKNYSVKDGLPSSETYCAMQDSKGFIWFGTDEGVARFDGYSFKNFTVENGLADNTIFGIYEDMHKRIWFRSLSGKLSYWFNDSIYSIGANDSIVKYMKNSLMISFSVDSGDTLWCGIRAGDGYYKIYPGYKGTDFHRVVPQACSNYIIKTGRQQYVYGNVVNNINHWDITVYKGNSFCDSVFINNLNTSSLHYVQQAPDTFMLVDINCMYLFTGKTAAPVFSFNDKDANMITCVTRAKKQLWISKIKQGIRNYMYSNGHVKAGAVNYLQGYSVTDVLADNEGGMWFTTLENGVYYLSPNHFMREYTLTQNTSSSHYLICKLDDKHITISKSKDTVDLCSADTSVCNINIHGATNLATVLGYNSYNLPVIIKTGNLYRDNSYSTYVQFSKNEKPLPLLSRTGEPLSCYLSAIDTVNKIMYALNRYYIFEMKENQPYAVVADTLPSRTAALYADNKGVLWLGCFNGLWAYNHHKFEYHGNDNPYLKDRIKSICRGRNGVYYFATFGNGVIIKDKDKYSRLTRADGLISDNCEDVFVDSYGTLWVGFKGGLAAVIKDTAGHYTVTKYNLADALPNQSVTQIEQTGNKLWVSSDNGIISHTLPVTKTKIEPSVFITQFTVNDVKHPLDSLCVLSYSQNRIKISFVGLSYNNFGNLQYSYRLTGLDTAWHTTQTPNVQFQYLPPGEYEFTVKAITGDGVVSRGNVHLAFTINKPFWETWWFRLLAVAAVLSFFYYRLRVIQKKEHEKTLMNKRMADIEMKALRAQMNPHFIFNAINSIQSHILKNDRKVAQDYLARFARLIRNVMENSKNEYIPLEQEMETLGLYISLEQLRAGGKFSYSINIGTGISQYNTLIPPLLLQPFVENSILHGLMPLQDKQGKLKIDIEKRDGKLVCAIEDNGIGRKNASEIRKMKAPAHRSMGISATEDRINILNGLNSGMADITITDMEGETTGTRVVITIPLITSEDNK